VEGAVSGAQGGGVGGEECLFGVGGVGGGAVLVRMCLSVCLML